MSFYIHGSPEAKLFLESIKNPSKISPRNIQYTWDDTERSSVILQIRYLTTIFPEEALNRELPLVYYSIHSSKDNSVQYFNVGDYEGALASFAHYVEHFNDPFPSASVSCTSILKDAFLNRDEVLALPKGDSLTRRKGVVQFLDDYGDSQLERVDKAWVAYGLPLVVANEKAKYTLELAKVARNGQVVLNYVGQRKVSGEDRRELPLFLPVDNVSTAYRAFHDMIARHEPVEE